MARVLGWLARPALLGALMTQIRLAARLVREPSVPAAFKALLALPAAYVLSPVDALPDLVPLLGQVDDVGVVLLALQAFVRICPPAAVAFHRAALAAGRRYAPMAAPPGGGGRDGSGRASPENGTVIEAEWRRE
jgi:uncharacterized membrane protein YkvA (DUF1232 family)